MAGFNFVRIPVQWDWHTGRTAPYAIDGRTRGWVGNVVTGCNSWQFFGTPWFRFFYVQVDTGVQLQLQGATDCPTVRPEYINFVIDLTGVGSLQRLQLGQLVTFKSPYYAPTTSNSIVFDNIIVNNVCSVTSQDIQSLGLGLVGDLSGDCYVNTDDLEYLATNWLNGLYMVDFDDIEAQWLDCKGS